MTGARAQAQAGLGHIAGLDSIRGLAAVTVCVFHTCDLPVGGSKLIAPGSILRVLFNGHAAVIMFFVLSGFVLRLSLGSRWAEPARAVAASFLVARVFRLFPTIVASLLVIVGANWLFAGIATPPDEILRNALLLDITINGAFWTLQVEVFGSLLVLFAFLAERRWGLWPVVAATLVLLPASFTGDKALFGSIVVKLLYPFLFGYLVAALPQVTARWERHAGMLLAAAVAAFYLAGTSYVLKQWPLFETVVSASLIVGIVAVKRYEAVLEWPPIHRLGTLSYSFYALHPLGLSAAIALGNRLNGAGLDHWRVALAAFAIAVSVSVVLALAMNYFVEKPGIAVGRKLNAALVPRRAVTV